MYKPEAVEPSSEDWSRWYRKNHSAAGERCFVELAPEIPNNVDTVIDFGCASGRNLELFDGRFKLYGVDLVPESQIEWRRPFQNLTYIASRLEELPGKLDVAMDRFLCISHGTLMYLDPESQRRFVSYLRERGCRNFIFQEYDRATLNTDGYWEPTLLNRLRRRRVGYPFAPEGFEKRWFRKEIPTWVRLA